MIGVVAGAADLSIAAELFELFKTPWEPAVSGRRYSVVLSSGDDGLEVGADLTLVYSASPLAVDRRCGVAVEPAESADLEWGSDLIPVYGALARFEAKAPASITARGRSVEYTGRARGRVVRRVGYDLFREVEFLLTAGQPASRAAIPTLELHLALLRHFLIEGGIAFVEIPPRPRGYDFTCCLTHDVDFFGIRRHRLDRTLAGFLCRGSVGSMADAARGRRPARDVLENLKAIASLPFVHLGLARDFWDPFADYGELEDPARSTFFMVPVRGRAGVGPDGRVDPRRAVPYQISDVAAHVQAACGRGSEIAVHGIDAWRDETAGRAELQALASVRGQTTSGVRMHWLYFSGDSPRQLEAAGFEYDSTWGYNDAVGYKAGTSQAFRFPGTHRLLELPLTIMDSALLSSGRQGLTEAEAVTRCHAIVADARRFGGTVVVNWHCRSLAPERLWRRAYSALLREVRSGNRVWFATASDAVEWYRSRRSITFSTTRTSTAVRVVIGANDVRVGSALQLTVREQSHSTHREIVFDRQRPIAIDVPIANGAISHITR